jgi:hypothetical protein
MRNPYQLGQIDPVAVLATVNTFLTLFQGKDQLPQYPISKQSTLDGLNASINKEIPLPPTSLANAQELLSQAIYLKAQKEKESGAGAATAAILYGERILALQNYIASQGGTVEAPAGSGSFLPRTTTPKTGDFIKDNPLIVYGGIGLLAFLLLRKKGRR